MTLNKENIRGKINFCVLFVVAVNVIFIIFSLIKGKLYKIIL